MISKRSLGSISNTTPRGLSPNKPAACYSFNSRILLVYCYTQVTRKGRKNVVDISFLDIATVVTILLGLFVSIRASIKNNIYRVPFLLSGIAFMCFLFTYISSFFVGLLISYSILDIQDGHEEYMYISEQAISVLMFVGLLLFTISFYMFGVKTYNKG